MAPGKIVITSERALHWKAIAAVENSENAHPLFSSLYQQINISSMLVVALIEPQQNEKWQCYGQVLLWKKYVGKIAQCLFILSNTCRGKYCEDRQMRVSDTERMCLALNIGFKFCGNQFCLKWGWVWKTKPTCWSSAVWKMCFCWLEDIALSSKFTTRGS